MSTYVRDGAEIYRRSFAMIREEADLSAVPDDVEAVVVRMIHACGMTDLVHAIAFSPDVAASGRAALRAGAPIITDAMMVAHGVTRARLPADNEVLCTRAGCHKGFLVDEDLIVVDRKGRKLRGSGSPTSEVYMHLACYDERPDIRAVVHTHPPISIAFTIANVSMARCVLPEVVLTLGTVPTVGYETTGTHDLADKIRPYIREHDAILMDRHGAVCLGILPSPLERASSRWEWRRSRSRRSTGSR